MANSETVNQPNERFLDAANESYDYLSAIKNYEKSPLVSLEEAIKSIEHLIDNLAADVWVAKNKCKTPTGGLTSDESAAIYLYTMESIYSLLNQALRDKRRERLVPWFSYLKLFLTALWKLPSEKCVVWRGVKKSIHQQFNEGENFFWWGLSSCTKSLSVLQSEQFLGESGARTLFNIECINGKLISNHSHFPSEHEILLLPCSYFEVLGKISQGHGLHTIHVRQVEPPAIFIRPPMNLELTSNNIPRTPNPNATQSLPKKEAVTLNFDRLYDEPRLAIKAESMFAFSMATNEKYLFYTDLNTKTLHLVDRNGQEQFQMKVNFCMGTVCWSSFLNQFIIAGVGDGPRDLYSFAITETRERITTLKEFERAPIIGDCHGNSIVLIMWDKEVVVREYNMSSWLSTRTHRSPASCDKTETIRSIKFTDDGSRFAIVVYSTGYTNYRLQLRDRYTLQVLQMFTSQLQSIYNTALPNDEYLLTIVNDKKLLLIDSQLKLKKTISYDTNNCTRTVLIGKNCLVVQVDFSGLLRFYEL